MTRVLPGSSGGDKGEDLEKGGRRRIDGEVVKICILVFCWISIFQGRMGCCGKRHIVGGGC